MSLMKNLSHITAHALHRVQILDEHHDERCSLASCAFGDDVVESDFTLWRDTPEAKASEWPVTAYLRIINQRLAPKLVELPPTQIIGSLRPAGITTDKHDRAVSWLKDFLQSGPKAAADLLMEGARAGHSDKMLYAVFDQMGGKKTQNMGKRYWELSPMNESGEGEKD